VFCKLTITSAPLLGAISISSPGPAFVIPSVSKYEPDTIFNVVNEPVIDCETPT
jgi:hypothetical protein